MDVRVEIHVPMDADDVALGRMPMNIRQSKDIDTQYRALALFLDKIGITQVSAMTVQVVRDLPALERL